LSSGAWFGLIRARSVRKDTIYSDADFIAGKANETCVFDNPPVRVTGFDPAFTNEGDRSIQVIGEYGNV